MIFLTSPRYFWRRLKRSTSIDILINKISMSTSNTFWVLKLSVFYFYQISWVFFIISYVFSTQIGQGTDISVRLNYTEEFSPILQNFDVEDDFSLVFGSFLHSETGSGYSFPLDVLLWLTKWWFSLSICNEKYQQIHFFRIRLLKLWIGLGYEMYDQIILKARPDQRLLMLKSI